jgi:multicomponent Na+:H+ antiporter subunit E
MSAVTGHDSAVRRVLALAVWSFAVWVLLTWTLTAEQLAFGAVLAALVAVSLAPTGAVVAPWSLLHPRRLPGELWLLVAASGRIVVANCRLAYRIWHPGRPLSSGMVITPTRERSDAGLTGVGIISSLIVDNQVVDLDRRRGELLYHAVAVPEEEPSAAYDAINGPVERLLERIEDPHD